VISDGTLEAPRPAWPTAVLRGTKATDLRLGRDSIVQD
jgi:hypothetical protein